MKKHIMAIMLLAIMLSSCSAPKQPSSADYPSTPTPVAATETPRPTQTETPSPTPTMTPTPTATPSGGKTLLAAYFSYDCEDVGSEKCITVSDMFSGEVSYQYPLNVLTPSTDIFWSPDGRYLMFMDYLDNGTYFDVMLLDVKLQEASVLKTCPVDMPIIQTWYKGELVPTRYTYDNSFGGANWTPDSRYVIYNTYLDSTNKTINVYSVDEKQSREVDGLMGSYYWLSDQKSIVDLKTGLLYDAETNDLTTIPYAYFMELYMWFDSYIVSLQGDSSYYPTSIYLYPYITDRDVLVEKGTSAIYDGEFLLAKLDLPKNKKPHLNVHELYFLDDTIILGGYLYQDEPYKCSRYKIKGSIDEIPFTITEDNIVSDCYDTSEIMMISPDGKLYFTEESFATEDMKMQVILSCRNMETDQVLNTFDFNELGKLPHDIRYRDHQNVAFFWQE